MPSLVRVTSPIARVLAYALVNTSRNVVPTSPIFPPDNIATTKPRVNKSLVSSPRNKMAPITDISPILIVART